MSFPEVATSQVTRPPGVAKYRATTKSGFAESSPKISCQESVELDSEMRAAAAAAARSVKYLDTRRESPTRFFEAS